MKLNNIKLIISILLLSLLSVGLLAQASDSLYFDIYLPYKLEGRGILYPETAKSDHSFRFDAWNEAGEPQPLVYIDNRILLNDYKTKTLFPLIIKVIKQDVNYLYLAVDENIRTLTQTKFLKVRKIDIDATGYRFLTMNDLIEVYRKNPDIVQNAVGLPLEKSTFDPKDNLYLTYYIKQKPDNKAPFIPIKLALDSKPEVTILSKDGYWFRVLLHFSFVSGMFGTQTSDGVIFTDSRHIGYWKATTDDLDYPHLLLSMLKPLCWGSFAKYVDNK